jgi:hypothetical protein
MEMNMQNVIEHDEVIVDLGTASLETKGVGQGDFDSIGTEKARLGIADD